jgi:hypothetical protein
MTDHINKTRYARIVRAWDEATAVHAATILKAEDDFGHHDPRKCTSGYPSCPRCANMCNALTVAWDYVLQETGAYPDEIRTALQWREQETGEKWNAFHFPTH